MRKFKVYELMAMADAQTMLFNAGLCKDEVLGVDKIEGFINFAMRADAELFGFFEHMDTFGDTVALVDVPCEGFWNLLIPAIFAYAIGDTQEDRMALLGVFKDLDQFKKHLVTELVVTKKLQGQTISLDDVCRMEHDDLSEVVVFYKDIEQHTGRFIVPLELAKYLDTNGYALISLAEKNAVEKRGVAINSIHAAIFGEEGCAPEYGACTYVVSHNVPYAGAATLFYPGVFSRLTELVGEDFWIIPSSIHEMIVVPESLIKGDYPAAILADMIVNVNKSMVSEEEQLTNHAYHYLADGQLFEDAFEFESRKRVCTISEEDEEDGVIIV